MNVSTFVGFIAALAVFVTALMMSAKNFMIFLDLHAILIVIGGTVAAALICFPMSKIATLLKVFLKRMLGKNRRNYLAIIEEIVTLSKARKRGAKEYESAAKQVQDPFLKDAAQAIFWLEDNVDVEKLRDLLETRAETHYARYSAEAHIFTTLAKFPPAFGLMGTTLGMIALLQSLGGENAKDSIGPAMSIALVATLYGIVVANFGFTPIAENLGQQSKEDRLCRRIVVEGVMLVAENEPTKFVEEKCKSFLLPSERGEEGGPGGGKSGQKAA